MYSLFRRASVVIAVGLVAAVAVIGLPQNTVDAIDNPAGQPSCALMAADANAATTLDQLATVAIRDITLDGADCATGTAHLKGATVTFRNAGLVADDVTMDADASSIRIVDGIFVLATSGGRSYFEIDPDVNGGAITAHNAERGLVFVGGGLRPTDRRPAAEAPIAPAGPVPAPEPAPVFVDEAAAQKANDAAVAAPADAAAAGDPAPAEQTPTTVAPEAAPAVDAAPTTVDPNAPAQIAMVESAEVARAAAPTPEEQALGLLGGFLTGIADGRIQSKIEFRAEGLYASMTLLDQLNVSGIIAWDGSYKLAVKLNNLVVGDPTLGTATISAIGTISGPSLDVDPVVDITGSITGALGLTKSIAITSGSIHITNSGLEINGQASIKCMSGSITASLNAQYKDEKNWNAGISAASPDACELDPGLRIAETNVTGTVTNLNGDVSGKLNVSSGAVIAALPEGLKDWKLSLDGQLTTGWRRCGSHRRKPLAVNGQRKVVWHHLTRRCA